MSDPTPKPVRFETEDDIRAAGSYVYTLRETFVEGLPLSLDEQRDLLEIAYAALLVARPRQAVNTAIWVDAGDPGSAGAGGCGLIPDWLKELQDTEEQSERQRP